MPLLSQNKRSEQWITRSKIVTYDDVYEFSLSPSKTNNNSVPFFLAYDMKIR